MIRPFRPRFAGPLAALALCILAAAASGQAAGPVESPIVHYDVLFDARIVPTERVARASIRLGKGASWVRWLRFRVDPERLYDFRGDGEVLVEGDTVTWTPPPGGGRLRYSFRIDHLRTSSSYDARCAEDWALFRLGDLFPAARVRSESTAHSRSRLRLRVPEGWSTITPYERKGSSFAVEREGRRFVRPVGWVVLGNVGVLRERIAGVRVAIAGPVGQHLRRQDLLALLRWTLPALRNVVGKLPERLLVVGAGDPMWRGGLSGPDSLYLHADRPLIAADTTSPVLHEVMHAVMGAYSGRGGDWVAEGFAELYSLELLVRTKTVSRRRYEKALSRLARRGRNAGPLEAEHSAGATTARAVTVLHELDLRVRERTGGNASLDDVLRVLIARHEPMTTQLLREAVQEVTGEDPAGFFRSRVGPAPAG